jgi:putative transposase
MVLYAYVIMDNHVHLIAAADDLSKEIGDFRSFTARQIVDWLQARNAQRVLTAREGEARPQNGPHVPSLAGGKPPRDDTGRGDDSPESQKVTYIHDNPVKRGYVDEAIHWRYSSARNYAGLPGFIEVTCAWE